MAFNHLSLLVFISIFLISTCQRGTLNNGEFLFLTNKDNVTSCVTNSYKPLFWTTANRSEDDQLDQQVSTFTKYRPPSPLINCDFDLAENCTSLWTVPDSTWKSANSLDVNLHVSLLDFRWENLELIGTSKNKHRNSRRFNTSSFEIGISFRLQRQGQIFLCESSSPSSTSLENCRAFVIQIDKSTLKSFTAKCKNLPVTFNDLEFNVTEQCSEFSEIAVIVVNYREFLKWPRVDYSDVVSSHHGSFWTHVKLVKTNGRVQLQLTDDEFYTGISEFTDYQFSPETNYVVLLNGKSDGDLWKFHDYQFIHTRKVSRNFQLQPALKPAYTDENAWKICMFVYLCPSCFLRIRMVGAKTGRGHQPSDYYQSSITSNWAQVVYNPLEIGEEYYLEISTLKRGNSTKSGIWAIDYVRYCDDTEYRTLELPKSAKNQNGGATCELVSRARPNTENLHEIKLEPYGVFADAKNCPENTLGSMCLPCESIFDQAANCSGIAVCEIDETEHGRQVCYCAGFGSKLERESSCAATISNDLYDRFSTDDEKKSFQIDEGGFLGTRAKIILIVGVTLVVILLLVVLVLIYVWRKRKVSKIYETGEGTAPDLIQTSKLPSYKRLLSRRKSNTKTVKKPVPVEHFENYVQEIVRSGDINEQLEDLIPIQRLYSVIRGPVDSRYEKPVDAIFADSYKSPKAFVILQGTNKNIKPQDVWLDVFKKDIQNIIWIAMNEKDKLWPELNESWNFNGITIETVTVQTNRITFKLKDEHDTLKMVNLDSILWESHIPLCSQKLSKISLELLRVSPSSKSPILIFNNTSDLNKAATILLCDSSLRMVAQDGQVDIYGQLKALANQIPPLFANFKYYPLVHYTVLESLVQFDTRVDCRELDAFIDKDLYKLHIRYVDRLLPDSTANVLKQHLVRTHVYGISPEISAVYVNGFRAAQKFIVVPQPLKAQSKEFWTLVTECEVSLIVTLNQHNNKFMQNSEATWVKTETFNNYDMFVGSMNGTTITIVCLLNWPFTEALPRNLKDFMEFFEKSISIATSSSEKVLVVCRDGVDAAGVYVALSYLIEQMKAGKLCDVPKAIQNARRSKNEFVRKKSQIKFLYRAANAYVQMFPEKIEK